MGLADELSKTKRQKLDNVKHRVTELYRSAAGLEGAYVPHNETHCMAVEEYLERIIPEAVVKTIKDEELFHLLCGAWLHDVGMIPKLFGRGDKSEMDEIRKEHQVRSARYLDDHWEDLGLELGDVDPIRKLCRYHRRSEELRELDGEPSLQFLVALLRLADACHSDYTRAPDDRYRLNLALGVSPEHLLHWVKSVIIEKVDPDHGEHAIKLQAIVPRRDQWFGADFSELIYWVVRDLEHELEGVRDCLAMHGITFTKVTYKKTEVKRKEWDEWGIFETLKAYQVPKSRSAGVVLDCVLDTLEAIAQKAAPDELENLLTRALESAIKQKGYQAGLQRLKSQIEQATSGKSGRFLRAAVRQNVREFRAWRRRARSRIAAIARQKDIVSANDCILVCGNSSCLRELLLRVPAKRRRTVEIYVGELRSKSEYDQLGRAVYNDGHELACALAEMGYRVSLIADAAVPHFLGKGQIKKVLTGANGIRLNGSSNHPVGHLMIAQSAKQFRVPLYVAAESFKIGDAGEVEGERTNLWLCGNYDAMFGNLTERNVRVWKPKGDVVPSDMISAFITEEGILTPDEIRARFRAASAV